MAKTRLAVCFDGTWNTPDKGAKPTNVVNMVRAIRAVGDDGVRQVAFYDKGVGTGDVLDRVAGGASGRGLTENVVDGYRFVANNFAPGDEIYIFGFSRGAYTARSLAGLIGLAGLLSPEDLGAGLGAVMEIYRRAGTDWAQKKHEIAALPFHEPRRDAAIACVGVWDTVGSLGVPGDLGRRFLGGKYYFHDVELGAAVDVALHAVAVDEKRSAFAPALWVSPAGGPVRADQKVEQVWFAGAHSNVGGSYRDSGLSDIAFKWMTQRVAALTGLALDRKYFQDAGPADCAAPGIDSRTALYKDSVLYPYQRVIGGIVPAGEGIGGWFRDRFESFDRRNIPPAGLTTVHEAIHVSLLERWNLPAVPHDGKDGDDSPAKVPYRPVNLKAVVDARRAGAAIPVVGWDGEMMDPAAAPWPV